MTCFYNIIQAAKNILSQDTKWWNDFIAYIGHKEHFTTCHVLIPSTGHKEPSIIHGMFYTPTGHEEDFIVWPALIASTGHKEHFITRNVFIPSTGHKYIICRHFIPSLRHKGHFIVRHVFILFTGHEEYFLPGMLSYLLQNTKNSSLHVISLYRPQDTKNTPLHDTFLHLLQDTMNILLQHILPGKENALFRCFLPKFSILGTTWQLKEVRVRTLLIC